MAGAKVVTLVKECAGKPAREAVRGQEPLSEPMLDRFPIWASARDPEQTKSLFRELPGEFRRAGFACDQDLQSDPHKSLEIVDYFQVFLFPKDAREPEAIGMVTLYREAQGGAVIKMNSECAGASSVFRKALSGAIERVLGGLAGRDRIDFSATISQQPDYRPR